MRSFCRNISKSLEKVSAFFGRHYVHTCYETLQRTLICVLNFLGVNYPQTSNHSPIFGAQSSKET